MGAVARALLVALLLTSVAHAAPADDPTATVKVTYEAPRALLVELRVPLAWHRADLPYVELELFETPFKRPGGAAQFIKLLDQSGAERPFVARVDQPGATLALRYRVHLDHVEAEPTTGPDDVPHATPHGWFLTGRAFLPQAIRTPEGKRLDVAATLELVGFPGKLVSTAGDGPSLRAASLAALRDAVYYSGDFVDTVIQPVPRVRLLSSDFSIAELAPLGTLVARTLALATKRFGPPVQLHVLLIVDRNRWTQVEGGVIGRAVNLLVRSPPTGRVTELPGTVVVHELLHLWHTSAQMWLGEGVVRLWEIEFRILLDQLDDAAALEELSLLWDRYAAEATGRSIRPATSSWVYHGGALLALCAAGPKRALDSLESIAALRDESGQLHSERWLGALAARDPAVAVRLLAQLDQPGPIDMRACLSPLGIEATSQSYSGFTPRALALKILRAPGLSTQSPTILKRLPDSPFETGDELVACNGARVPSLNTLDWLLRDARAGDEVRCTVRRADGERAVRFSFPALEATDRATHQRLQLARPARRGASWPH